MPFTGVLGTGNSTLGSIVLGDATQSFTPVVYTTVATAPNAQAGAVISVVVATSAGVSSAEAQATVNVSASAAAPGPNTGVTLGTTVASSVGPYVQNPVVNVLKGTAAVRATGQFFANGGPLAGGRFRR